MKNKFDRMESDELKKELDRLYEERFDLEQEWNFTLSKTPVHLPESTRNRLAQDLSNLNTRIEAIEAILRERGFGTDFLRKKS